MKKIIASLIILLFSFILYYSISIATINQARSQNNFNLNSIMFCLNSELEDSDHTKIDLTHALNTCAKGVRSLGVTGDSFVIRESDRKLFWDASLDCRPEKSSKLFMTEEGICSLFRDKESCLVGTKYMIDNKPKGFIQWTFDNSTELLDYRYIDKTIDNEKYILVQGSQTDEINNYFLLSYLLILINCVVLLILINF